MTLTRVFFVGLLLWIPVATHAQKPQPTFVAVVDEQGRLTPIAVYDGAIWWNRWPWGAESDEIRTLPVPRSLSAIPADWLPPGLHLPFNWQSFPPAGKPVPIRALRPERSPETAMMDTFVIRTTYRGPAAAAANGDQDAFAISGPGVLGRFVTPPDREQSPILRQLEPRIAILEKAAIARWRAELLGNGEKNDVPLTRTYRIDDPAAVRYVSTPPAGNREFGVSRGATAGGDLTAYYLHGEKLFKLRPNDDCKMNLSSGGFVIVGADGRVVSEKISSMAYSEFCGDPAEMLFPLATITIGHRTWWIVKISLEDGYDYGLIDPLTGEPVEIKELWPAWSDHAGR